MSSTIQRSLLTRLPYFHVDHVASFLPHPHNLERVSHYFSDNRDKLFGGTWKMLLKRLQEGPDLIIGGLVNGVVQHYSKNVPLKTDLVVKQISATIISKARIITLSFPPLPRGPYDRRSLSEIARAADITNFFLNIGTFSAEAAVTSRRLPDIVRFLPEQRRNILGVAAEVSRWLVSNIGQLGGIQITLNATTSRTRDQTQFTHLPPLVGLLTGLRKLSYGHDDEQVIQGIMRDKGKTWLKDLPQEIESCTYLREVILSRNMFESIPLSLLNCTRLEHINLAYNKITVLPPRIGQLRALQTLWLSGNDLERLPSEIGSLTALTKLSLNSNPRLANLPIAFWCLTSLRTLNLSKTALTSLSSRIGRLTSLETLSLHQCKIKKIPAEMAACIRLTLLDLRENQLQMSHKAIRSIVPFLPPGDLASRTGLILSPREEKKGGVHKHQRTESFKLPSQNVKQD